MGISVVIMRKNESSVSQLKKKDETKIDEKCFQTRRKKFIHSLTNLYRIMLLTKVIASQMRFFHKYDESDEDY